MSLIRRHAVHLAVAGLLVMMLVAMVASSLGDSVTADEIPHIAAGYSYLTEGDYRYNPAHPPLIKDLAAIPLLMDGVEYPRGAWAASSAVDQWGVGEEFLYGSGNDPERVLLLARLPMMLLSLVLGLLVFVWARELFGTRAGLFALILYTFNTSVLAHSRLVTMDVGLSLFVFLTMYLTYRFLAKPSWPRLLAAGLGFGAALATKLMAVLLVPAFLVVFVLLTVQRGRSAGGSTLQQVHDVQWMRRAWAGLVALTSIVATAVVAAYVFFLPHAVNTPPEVVASIPAAFALPSPLKGLLIAMSTSTVTKPLVVVASGLLINASSAANGHVSFLLGQVSRDGWWYYYPVALALKTQLPLFVLAATAIAYRRRFRTLGWFAESYLMVVPAVFLVASMVTRVDLGIRYLLPIYPFIFVSLSRCAAVFDTGRPARIDSAAATRPSAGIGRVPLAIVSAMMVWYVAGAVFAYPHYIAYFNEVAGGHERGGDYLRDSNLDWGQDVKRLADWADRRGVARLYVDVFPDPASARHYLGEKMTPWSVEQGRPDGLFAVSANVITAAEAGREENGGVSYDWLRELEPVARIGGSVRVYDCRVLAP